MAESMSALARKMGMTVSDLADAKPWEVEALADYSAKHGSRAELFGYPGIPDVQIASAVRMLMRNDLDHESVVCAARDRICVLHVEKFALLAALRTAEAFMAGFEGDELQDGIDAKLAEIRAAIAQAEGRP